MCRPRSVSYARNASYARRLCWSSVSITGGSSPSSPNALRLGLGERGALVQERSLEKVDPPRGGLRSRCDRDARNFVPSYHRLMLFQSAHGWLSLWATPDDTCLGLCDAGTTLPGTWERSCHPSPRTVRVPGAATKTLIISRRSTIQSNSSAFTTRDSTHHPRSPMPRNECRPVVGTLWPALRSPRMISSHTRRPKASGKFRELRAHTGGRSWALRRSRRSTSNPCQRS